MLTLLRNGFLATNSVYLVVRFWLFRSSVTKSSVLAYILSEIVAVSLWLSLQSMARQGNDLQQSGLTQYMFDIVYVTWFVQLASLLWSKLWWLYLIVRARALCQTMSRLLTVCFCVYRRFPGMQDLFCTRRFCFRTCFGAKVLSPHCNDLSRVHPRRNSRGNSRSSSSSRNNKASDNRNFRHAPQKAIPVSKCATASARPPPHSGIYICTCPRLCVHIRRFWSYLKRDGECERRDKVVDYRASF